MHFFSIFGFQNLSIMTQKKSYFSAVDEESVKFERINTLIHKSSQDASSFVAKEIIDLVLHRQKEGKKVVLGLATGSTPIKVYDYLVKAHKEKGVSFSNVITFNLDEYFPMDGSSIHSYKRFMKEHLFEHIDIPEQQIHLPNGQINKEDLKKYSQNYEQKIKEAGGIDIQILGIGRTGHIGFNEPGSSLSSKTRMVRLDRMTMLDAASDFFGKENVPTKAITMGVGTIMSAKRIILMAWGEGKSNIIKQAVEGPIQESVPATFLQSHPNCNFIIDKAAATSLTRVATPWLVGDCDWEPALLKKLLFGCLKN